jgi:Glycine/D-amino acid oxidases (deaminating)
MQTADVAIIGGGVIGCSIAYHLARSGMTNGVLFERKHVASGATGICPGGIRQQFEGEAECKLARRSMHFFEQANEILEPESRFFLERSGYLFLAQSAAVLSGFRRNVALQNRLGIPSRVVTASEIAEIVPALVCDGVLGGSFCGEDGFLEDCDGFTYNLLRRARDKGFTLALSEVTRLEQEGRAWRLDTSSGSWLVERVVIAAGTESPSLASSAGVLLPITVERRRLAYTEPCGESVMHPLVVARERSFAGKQLQNGVFYLGWLDETSESDDLSFIEQALTAGALLLPVMEELQVRRVVTGYYDSTPDHRPILGAIGGLDGLYLATGFSGHGFMLAPAVGEIMAQLIGGSKIDPLLQDFSIERFSGSPVIEGLQI